MGQPEPDQELDRQQVGVIARDAIHLDPITRPEIAEMDGI
jgi:chromosome segregation and condensation protein ScpB